MSMVLPPSPKETQNSPCEIPSHPAVLSPHVEKLDILVQYCIWYPQELLSKKKAEGVTCKETHDGHAFITVDPSITLSDLKAEVLQALRAPNNPNNTKPIPDSTAVDTLHVEWACPKETTQFPFFSIVSEDNVSSILRQMHKRSGYDFIWVDLKGDNLQTRFLDKTELENEIGRKVGKGAGVSGRDNGVGESGKENGVGGNGKDDREEDGEKKDNDDNDTYISHSPSTDLSAPIDNSLVQFGSHTPVSLAEARRRTQLYEKQLLILKEKERLMEAEAEALRDQVRDQEESAVGSTEQNSQKGDNKKKKKNKAKGKGKGK